MSTAEKQVSDRIMIFDTTLRDGEQSPGASMNREEKLQVARALARLNVDVIEAGFPIASPGDFEAVQAVAEAVDGPVVAGLARSLEKDIKAAAGALKNAKHPRIHVFLATSAIHREFKLRKAKEEIVKQATAAVQLAKSLCREVEFSPEDASRTEPEFLCEVVEAVIEAGAGIVNIPDTVGYAIPEEFGKLIAYLRQHTPNIEKAAISVHCHNDLGMAVSNSLAAVKNGARQVECTVNGIGERAGNAALEEIVMSLHTRRDWFGGLSTGIDTTRLVPTSKLVSGLTGLQVQRNKAVVGENAFAHEAGIHQDGVLKERSTYEIMRSQDVGAGKSQLVMGKHSGKHALRERLQELGFTLDKKELEETFERFKVLCDKKKTVYDADLIALAEDQLETAPPLWKLDLLQVAGGNRTVPTATVRLRKVDVGKEEVVLQDAATGDGPVEALTNAVDRMTGLKGQIKDYQVQSVTHGREAQGEVNVKVEINGKVYSGRGLSTDIIEASARAYLNAVCRAAAQTNEQPAGEPVGRGV